MLVETIFAGRNNSFSLQLYRGGEPISLMSVTGYELHLIGGGGELVFDDSNLFIEKDGGIVEIQIGHLLSQSQVGSYSAYLVTFDLVNELGVRWPNFKLKVKK